MKTRLIFLSICFVIFSLTTSANTNGEEVVTGSSLTEFGDYAVLVASNPITVDNVTVETYDLKYENIENPIKIGVLSEKNCTTFIVKSNGFEVEYQCKKGEFGVRRIESKYRELSRDEVNSKLDGDAFEMQRVITEVEKSQDQLLGLIACYFPNLVADQYKTRF